MPIGLETRDGVCVSCGGSGPAGTPCPGPVCARGRYARIPREYARGDPATRDPRIGRFVDDYLVAATLGTGGFGSVYLALQAPLGVPVALKVLRLEDQDPVTRGLALRAIEAEASALAALHHPHIVQMHRYGTVQDTPYIAMECVVGGRSLRAEIARRSGAGERFAPAEILDVALQVLDGLEAAHERGIVHRDVKPENLLLEDVAGRPAFLRIADFGLARSVLQSRASSRVMGSPDYMAPEQIEGLEIGPWTDLYALGVIVFELATGALPFPGRTWEEVFAAKLAGRSDPADAPGMREQAPAFRAFVRQALARDPAVRHRDVDAFRAGLQAALAPGPAPAARDPGPPPDGPPPLPSPSAGPVPDGTAQRRADAFRAWLDAEAERLMWSDRAPRPARDPGRGPG